jgi:hypothetical protein
MAFISAPDQQTPPDRTVDRAVAAIKRHPIVAAGIVFLFLFLVSGHFDKGVQVDRPVTSSKESAQVYPQAVQVYFTTVVDTFRS